MTEISTMLLVFLVEGLFALLIILLVWAVLAYRRNRRDRSEVNQLVQKIREQSTTRRQSTSDFLQEKYLLQGDALESALNEIDHTEKKFLQHILNTYLHRDAQGVSVIDAGLRELLDLYRQLTPQIPQPEPVSLVETQDSDELNEEIQQLQQSNAQLLEELKASRQAMAAMIEEFGSLFGGVTKHELPSHELMEKLNRYKDGNGSERFNDVSLEEVQLDMEEETDDQINRGIDLSDLEEVEQDRNDEESTLKKSDHYQQHESGDTMESGADKSEVKKKANHKKETDEKKIDVVDQDEIDDLLDSIDLSSDNLK